MKSLPLSIYSRNSSKSRNSRFKKTMTLLILFSTLSSPMALAGGEQNGFLPGDLGSKIFSASLSMIAIGVSIGGVAFAEEVTPDQLRATVSDLEQEIGKKGTANLIQAMNNCNDPETLSLPEKAPIAKKIVNSYEEVFIKCLQN